MVDLQNHTGWTALLHAAYKGDIQVCTVLLEKNANVNH